MTTETTETTETTTADAPGGDSAETKAEETSTTETETTQDTETEADKETTSEKESGESEDQEPAGPPEKYEFEMPEGFEELDEELIDQATPIFKDLGLSNEQAQKLVNFEAQRQREQQEAWAAQVKDWEKALKSDKDFGGDKFDANLGKAKALLKKYGSDELVELMDSTMLGSHPEMVRWAMRVAKALGEDSVSDRSGPRSKPERTAEEVFYSKVDRDANAQAR